MAKNFVSTIETRAWAAEWQKSAALQKEFRTEAEYVGFKRAEAEGRVSFHGLGRTSKEQKPAA